MACFQEGKYLKVSSSTSPIPKLCLLPAHDYTFCSGPLCNSDFCLVYQYVCLSADSKKLEWSSKTLLINRTTKTEIPNLSIFPWNLTNLLSKFKRSLKDQNWGIHFAQTWNKTTREQSPDSNFLLGRRGIGPHPASTQEMFLVLCSWITLGSARGTYVVHGFEPVLAIYKYFTTIWSLSLESDPPVGVSQHQ